MRRIRIVDPEATAWDAHIRIENLDETSSDALSQTRREFYEGLCHNYRRGVRPACCGPHLACHRGRSRPGEGSFLYRHYPCRGGVLSLGLAIISEVGVASLDDAVRS